jgi:hypothetical protein
MTFDLLFSLRANQQSQYNLYQLTYPRNMQKTYQPKFLIQTILHVNNKFNDFFHDLF